MLHNITEFEIRDGLYASHDVKDDSKTIIFRIIKKDGEKWETLAVANVTEHAIFGVQECYTEAVMMKQGTTIDDFRVLYEDLKFYLTWYKHQFDGLLYAYVIDQTYFKNKYGTKAKLRQVANKFKRVK